MMVTSLTNTFELVRDRYSKIKELNNVKKVLQMNTKSFGLETEFRS